MVDLVPVAREQQEACLQALQLLELHRVLIRTRAMREESTVMVGQRERTFLVVVVPDGLPMDLLAKRWAPWLERFHRSVVVQVVLIPMTALVGHAEHLADLVEAAQLVVVVVVVVVGTVVVVHLVALRIGVVVVVVVHTPLRLHRVMKF